MSVVMLLTSGLILWICGWPLQWKVTQENQPVTLDVIELSKKVSSMRVELALLRASISNSTAITTTNLTKVPVVEETDTVTETSSVSVSAEKNHKEGVSVNQSTNGVAIKVVADKDSRVSVNIRGDKDTEQSQNPVHNAHRVVELDATDGRLDTVTGIYKLTNTVYALEKVLFQIPEGWSMQAHAAYPHGMLKVLDEKGNPLGGKLVSGGCMFVQNLSQTIDVKLRWECMKIPMTNK